jgi:hypothetical protein
VVGSLQALQQAELEAVRLHALPDSRLGCGLTHTSHLCRQGSEQLNE